MSEGPNGGITKYIKLVPVIDNSKIGPEWKKAVDSFIEETKRADKAIASLISKSATVTGRQLELYQAQLLSKTEEWSRRIKKIGETLSQAIKINPSGAKILDENTFKAFRDQLDSLKIKMLEVKNYQKGMFDFKSLLPNLNKLKSDYLEVMDQIRAGSFIGATPSVGDQKGILSSFLAIEKEIERANFSGIKEQLDSIRAKFDANKISAQEWNAEILSINTKGSISLKEFGAIMGEVKASTRAMAGETRSSLKSVEQQIKETFASLASTGPQAATAQLTKLMTEANRTVPELEALNVALKNIEPRWKEMNVGMLNAQLDRLNQQFKLSDNNVTAYKMALESLRASAMELGLPGTAIDKISIKIKELDGVLAKSNIESFRNQLSKLNTEFYKGNISREQFLTGLKNLQPLAINDAKATEQLAKAIMVTERQIGSMTHSLGFLGQAFRTAKHHAMWMLSGSLIMPLYNLPSEILTIVTELDKSFAKLRSVFMLDPDTAKDLNNVKKIMAELTQWSYRFSQYYGEDITKINEAMFSAAQRYKKSADIVVVSNAALKLSLLDFNNDLEISMTNLMAVMAQYDIAPAFAEDFVNKVIVAGNAVSATAGQIIEAMKRSSSVIRQVGGDVDTAISIIAISLDRAGESAETLGTTWKTLAQRMSTGKVGEFLSKNQVKLFEDATGQARDFNTVIQEMMGLYSKLSDKQRANFVELVAGVRQGNRLVNLLRDNIVEGMTTYDKLHKMLSETTTRSRQEMVAPAVADQLQTLERRVKSTQQVWAAFVYQLMDTGEYKKTLYDVLNFTIKSLNWMIEHRQDILSFAKAILYLGGVYVTLNMALGITKGLIATNILSTASLASTTGTWTLSMEGATVASGELAIATKTAAGGFAAMALSMAPVLVALAAAVALYKEWQWYANKPIHQAEDFHSSVYGGKGGTPFWDPRGWFGKGKEKSYGASIYEQYNSQEKISKKIAENEKQISNIRHGYYSEMKGAQSEQIKTLEQENKTLEGMSKRLKEIQNLEPTMTYEQAKEPGALNIYGFMDELEKQQLKATKDALGAINQNKNYGDYIEGGKGKGATEQAKAFKDAMSVISSSIKNTDTAVTISTKNFDEYIKLFDDYINKVKGETGDLYGEIITGFDVKRFDKNILTIFPMMEDQISGASGKLKEFESELQSYKGILISIEDKLKSKSLTEEQKTDLEGKKNDLEIKIENVNTKIKSVKQYIEELPGRIPEIISAAADELQKGLDGSFRRIDEMQNQLAKNSKVHAVIWYQNWINEIEKLKQEFPKMNEVVGEMQGKDPVEYIHGLENSLKALDYAQGSEIEKAPERLALKQKIIAANEYMNNVINQQSDKQNKLNSSLQAENAISEARYEYKLSLLRLAGNQEEIDRYTISHLNKTIDSAKLTAFYYTLSGDKAGYWAEMQKAVNAQLEIANINMEAFQRTIQDNINSYDNEIAVLEDVRQWKLLNAREDQKSYIDFQANVIKRNILIRQRADLEKQLTGSTIEQQAILRQSIKETDNQIQELNRTIYSTIPLMSEIKEATTTAFNSIRDNIKQTFTDLLDSSKSFMESLTEALQRQSEILKNTVIEALTTAVMTKFGKQVGSQAEQSGKITSSIFSLFGIEVPEEQKKSEEIWNKVFDKTNNALRVIDKTTSADGAASTTGSATNYVAGVISDALGIGKSSKAKTSSRYKTATSETSNSEYSNVDAITAIGMQYIAQQYPEIASGPGYNIGSLLGSAYGPLGSATGSLVGAMFDNAFGVGRGESRRNAMNAQAESRQAQIDDIISRYESIGLSMTESQLNIPAYIEESERSFLGLAGTSRWYINIEEVTAALDKAEAIIDRIETAIENYNNATETMQHSLAMGAAAFNIAGENLTQTIGKWITTIDPLASGGETSRYTLGTVDELYGPNGIIVQNIRSTSDSFNVLTSTVELLEYQLNELAQAGGEGTDAFNEISEQLLEAMSNQYWANITSGITKSQFLQQFGIGTDQTLLEEYSKAIREAFGLGENQTITEQTVQMLANSIADAYVMAQTGAITGVDAEYINQQAELLTSIQSLMNDIGSNQLSEAATTSADSLGESISGSSTTEINENNFYITAENIFDTSTSLTNITRAFVTEAKRQGLIKETALNI